MFKLDRNVVVSRDDQNRIRALSHPRKPWSETKVKTPQNLAHEYVRDVATHYRIPKRTLGKLGQKCDGKFRPRQREQIRFLEEKEVLNRVVISYQQTVHNLPVWKRGVSVTVQRQDADQLTQAAVIKSQVNILEDLKITNPDFRNGKHLPGMIDEAQLREVLEANDQADAAIKITASRLLVYRYDKATRFTDFPKSKMEPEAYPFPKLPSVARGIKDGTDYVVTEVLATFHIRGYNTYNARAFVEPISGSVLYFRLLVAHQTGYVYERDPISQGGTHFPTAPTADLNTYRTSVSLPGVNPPVGAADYELVGTYIELQNISDPPVAPPTEPTGVFEYDVTTDDFSAVNAYYHSDAVFRAVANFGFNMSSYFDGTTFPVPVDHRATISTCSDCVNAEAPGTPTGDGSAGFRYALAAAGTSVGIADDIRVVWHEFGHSVLWDNLWSPNFPFAHSCGDSFAAIAGDPGSQAPREQTFPWIYNDIDREHMRDVGAGWGWGGSQDVGGYESEQILSTSHFRAYRYSGGDDNYQARRQFASDYMMYLLFAAVGGLSPAAPPTVEDWVRDLMDADTSHTGFTWNGIHRPGGGGVHKVIRWAFEKQDLFGGNPPAVDVYIDDGRNGEYAPHIQNFWETQDVWNRYAMDATPGHQEPHLGVTNYLYVRVRNRGTQPATGVSVKTYRCVPGAGLVFPTDWTLIGQLPSPDLAANTGVEIVGPFPWVPTEAGHECLLATVTALGATDALTDEPNTDTITGNIAHWLLVPYDNNIAQHNVAPFTPAGGSGGGSGLIDIIDTSELVYVVRNPFDSRARIRFDIKYPKALLKYEPRVVFDQAIGEKGFTLPANGRAKVSLAFKLGKPVKVEDLVNVRRPQMIEVHVIGNGICIGGWNYQLVPPRKPVKPRISILADKLLKKRLLSALDLSEEAARVRSIQVTIDLPDDDD